MSNPSAVIVHKGRVNIVTVRLGIDVSGDTLTSEIRSQPDHNSPLIATWDVEFDTDGTDGVLILTLDDVVTGQITASSGFMDVKRVSGTDALPIFDEPLEVVFQGTVTA